MRHIISVLGQERILRCHTVSALVRGKDNALQLNRKLFVPTMYWCRRMCYLDSRKVFEYSIAVLGALRHHPRVPRTQGDQLPFRVQFRPSREHIPNSFIVASGWRLGVSRFLRPKPHRHVLAHRKMLLAHSAARRVRAVDFDDGGIRHISEVGLRSTAMRDGETHNSSQTDTHKRYFASDNTWSASHAAACDLGASFQTRNCDGLRQIRTPTARAAAPFKALRAGS